MCSSIFGLRNQTLSPSSTSASCNVSESCTTLSCALIVKYIGIHLISLSLETTLLPCSDPYGVHLLVTSVLGSIVNDTFTQSRNLTISLSGLTADVIVDITQQCYGLMMSVSCCYLYLFLFTITVLFTISKAKVFIEGSLLELIPPTNIYMFCPPPPGVSLSLPS